jgi:hypothetical protein
MGNTAKHTDLSWEVPGIRAYVPLTDIEYVRFGPESWLGVGEEPDDALNVRFRDDTAGELGDFQ